MDEVAKIAKRAMLRQKISQVKKKIKTVNSRYEGAKESRKRLGEGEKPATKAATALSNTAEELGKGAGGLPRFDQIRQTVSEESSSLFGLRDKSDDESLGYEISRLNRELSKLETERDKLQYQLDMMM